MNEQQISSHAISCMVGAEQRNIIRRSEFRLNVNDSQLNKAYNIMRLNKKNKTVKKAIHLIESIAKKRGVKLHKESTFENTLNGKYQRENNLITLELAKQLFGGK